MNVGRSSVDLLKGIFEESLGATGENHEIYNQDNQSPGKSRN